MEHCSFPWLSVLLQPCYLLVLVTPPLHHDAAGAASKDSNIAVAAALRHDHETETSMQEQSPVVPVLDYMQPCSMQLWLSKWYCCSFETWDIYARAGVTCPRTSHSSQLSRSRISGATAPTILLLPPAQPQLPSHQSYYYYYCCHSYSSCCHPTATILNNLSYWHLTWWWMQEAIGKKHSTAQHTVVVPPHHPVICYSYCYWQGLGIFSWEAILHAQHES